MIVHKRIRHIRHLGFIFLFLAAPVFAGFGISPGTILENHAIAGASFIRTIYLVQGDPIKPAHIHVEVESRDMKDWITFSSGTELTIPVGVQQFPLPIEIKIPEGTPLGVYKAFVRVTTTPDQANDSGEVAIALGGRVDVTVTVGDDVLEEFSIKNIDIPDITKKDEARVLVTIANTGNVPTLPDSASFELFDKFGNIRLAFSNRSFDVFEKTPAFSEKQYTLEFPLDIVLAPGEYWGHARIYTNEGAVIRELKKPFNVYRGENFAARIPDFLTGQSTLVRAGVTFVVIALILFIILWVIRRKRMPQAYE